MVTDAIVRPLLFVFEWLLGLLPDWSPDLPAVDSVVTKIAQLNSLVPIGPPIQLALVMLSFVGVFLLIRLVLLVRHTVLP
jgi:hypothetical protein